MVTDGPYGRATGAIKPPPPALLLLLLHARDYASSTATTRDGGFAASTPCTCVADSVSIFLSFCLLLLSLLLLTFYTQSLLFVIIGGHSYDGYSLLAACHFCTCICLSIHSCGELTLSLSLSLVGTVQGTVRFVHWRVDNLVH